MDDLVIVRAFSAHQQRVFEFITKETHLLDWWGPEGMFVPEGRLDFTSAGPWYSVMQNKEGQKYKVSGTVLSVAPPDEVVFTWAWHDPEDVRGEETTVRFSLAPLSDGRTQLTLTHGGFATEESKGNHESGWTSSLRKLEAYFS